MTSRYPSLSSYFWVALSLLLAISFAYANSLSVPFLFDDKHTILDDQFTKELKSFLSLSHVRYRHLFYMSFALNYHWDQFNTPGYHLVNISLHVLTSMTVFVIAFLTIDKGVGWGRNAAFRIALITAFLFALNPVHSETVTYISGRANGLSAFFYCLALLLFILGSLRKSGFARLILYPLSLIAVASAVLSKETTVTFPLIAVLYDLCFMRGDTWIRLRGRLLYYYLPVPVIGCVLIFKAAALTSIAKWWLNKIDFLYALLQTKIINFPIKLFFFPINLTFDYNFPKVLDFYETGFLLSAVFLLVLAVLAAKIFFIRSPILSFAILWYFITLLPTNSFIPRIDLFSERNLYLPSFGLSLFFAVAFYLAFFSGEKKRAVPVLVGAGCLMMILSFNSALLIKRNSIYRSDVALWEDTVQKSPRNLRAMQNLSRGYLLIDDYQNAFAVLRRMLELNPSYYYTRVNLGKVYVQFGQLSQAETEFKAAIQGHPDLPEAYFNLGSLYAGTGNLSEARELYASVDLNKLEDIETRLKWFLHKARVEFEMNLYEEAENGIKDYFKIVETTYGLQNEKSNRPEARLLLGQIYSRTGREPLSVEEFAKVRGDKSLEASAHNSLGLVYIGQARHEEAIQELGLAVSLNPLLPEAQFNLGKLFLEARNDRVSAREHLDAALALVSDPDKRETINHLLRQLDH